MLKNRRSNVLLLAAVALTALFVVGCGSGGGGGSSSSSAGPANLAAPGSVVFVEGNLRPSGELKANADAVTKKLTGAEGLSDFIVSELESSAQGDGESVDFATEVEPWLGKAAGIAFRRLEGEELSEPLIAVQTTNVKEAKAFIEKRASESSKPYKKGSYKGSDFEVGGTEGNAMGVIGEWAVIADGEKEFKAAVDAHSGESLADESRFQDAIADASEGSLADVYVDIGALIQQSGGSIDSQAQEILESSGIDPSEATAVASVIPGSEEITVDLSSNLGGEKAPSGDVSELLGSAPTSSFAAFAVAGFGEQLEEAIDNVDESGIPPDVKPGELKDTLSQAGVDVDKIAASLEEAVVFAEGSNLDDLGGAVIVASKSSEAAEAVASFGTLLRGANVPGITAVSGNASGFSVHSSELGGKPLVVVGAGKRIAIGYGLPQALKGLNPGSGSTLADTPAYKAAVTSLGKTPISAYVDGPAALQLAEALVPRSKKGFWEAQPYLKKIAYMALGTGTNGDLATAKLIAGLSK
jgi:Protein of unknown function (DUF3352)